MGLMEDLIDAGTATVTSQLTDEKIGSPLTFDRMASLIAEAYRSGTDFRPLTDAGELAFARAGAKWNAPGEADDEESVRELARRVALFSYLTASGAGDFQLRLGGRDGSWIKPPEHKRYRLGLWKSTERALASYSTISGDPMPTFDPKPQGCLVLLVALASATAAMLLALL